MTPNASLDRDVADLTQVEKALHASERRYRSLVKATSLLDWLSDPSGDVIEDNPRWREFTGQTYEQIKGSGWLEAVHPDDRAVTGKIWARSTATRTMFDAEYRVRRHDGVYRMVLSRALPILDDDGSVCEWVGSCTDITELKQAETALQASELRYRSVVMATSQFDWITDASGSVTEDLPRWREFTGHTFEEIKGSDWMSAIHPDDRGPTSDAWFKTTTTGTSFDVEFRARRHDGEYRILHSRGVPILAEDGSVREWVGSCADVTELKQVEKACQTSELRYRSLVTATSQMDWITDGDGQCVENVPRWREFTGQTFEEVRGSRWLEAVHPDDREATRDAWIKATETRTLFEKEYRVRRRDGEYRIVLSRGVPILAEDGSVREWVGSCADITERKQAEAEREEFLRQLRAADHKKDEFLAMLGHELRNPLAAVRNAVTILTLTDDVKYTADAREIIERQTGQLSRLIDDLLDVSRITSGKIRLQVQRVDAAVALRQAIEQVEPLIETRKHTLVSDFQGSGLELMADPTRLEQMVVNLLTNAAKYTQDGGSIRLRAAREANDFVISVQDNGCGIPHEQISEMFELFSQGDRSLARSEGGLGIGLTIVKSLAEMHGGSVTTRSDGPGRGSTFTLRLPAAHQLSQDVVTSETTSHAGHEDARVLVVEDNQDTASSMAAFLRLSGHRVEVAGDGYAAIKAARNLKPDYVLLDIGLPGLDGYEVARRLRQELACKNAVIVAVTGYGQDEDRHRSQEAGFDHHLVKPIDFDKLTAILVRR